MLTKLVKSILLIMCLVLIQLLGNKSLYNIITIIIFLDARRIIDLKKDKYVYKEERIIGTAKRIIGIQLFGNKRIE